MTISNSFASNLTGLKKLDLGRAIEIPRIEVPRFEIPRLPTEEEKHAYESSGDIIRRTEIKIKAWQRKIPKDSQPVILAILANGVTVRVSRLSQEGHNGVTIEGRVDDAPCFVFSHQNTLQLLCYVEHMDKPESEKCPIGFHYQRQEPVNSNPA
jgi:hypothetical protein